MPSPSARGRLSEWLGVREGDRRDAAWGFVTLLLVIGGHTMVETARDTLFLSDLPATRLPWAYLTIAVLALLTGSGIGAVTRASPPGRNLTLALVGVAGGTLTFWWLTAAREPETLFALYVWTGLAASLVTMQFWLRAGSVLDVARAKRVFTLIAAGGLAGATLGAALAASILQVAAARALILGGALLFLAAALANRLWGHGAAVPTERSPADRQPRLRLRELVRRDPYLWRLLVVTIVATVVVTGLDYVFKSAVAEHVPRERLGPFLARYHTAVNASALVFQLFVAPRILQGVGVVGALVLLPSLVAVGTAVFAAVGGLAAVLVAKGADGTMRHSLDRAGNEILHLPLAGALREQWKAVTTGLGQRGGQALASLALLAAAALGVTQGAIAAGVAALGALWVATLLALRPHYVGRFREQLRSFRFGSQGSLPPLDVPALEILVAALGSAEDAETLAALDVLESYEKQHLVSPLMVHHPSAPVALRALELLAASGRDDLPRLVDRALGHPDPEVRAAVLRVRTLQAPDERLLRQHLTDPSPAVRCVALAGLVGAGLLDEAKAEAVLHDLFGTLSVEACPMLARALVDLPPSLGQPLARELRAHPDPRFGVAIARALAAEPNPLFLETLIELLAARDARTDARMALVSLGAPALERLGAALNDPRTPDGIRLHVPRSISRFPGARAAALLVARLPREADSRVRYKILRALGRLRVDDPELPLDEDTLREAAEVLLARAALLLTYRVAWELLERDGARRPPLPRLLPDLLADKERRATEAVFRVLHILEPGVGYDVAYRGLAADDARARADGREIVENVLRGRLRDAVLALTDTGDPAARLALLLTSHEPPDARALLELVDGRDPRALAAVVARVAARVTGDPNPLVREIARWQLGAGAAEVGEGHVDAR